MTQAKEQIVHTGLPVSADVPDAAQQGDRPNILLICTDQLRADFLGVNGHPVCQTPHLDALAKSGINFRQSMSECPVCCPARRILMTGRDPFGIHMFQNRDLQPFPEGPKLAECISAAGYQTHAVGKMHTWPPRDRMGFQDIELNEEGRTAGHTYPDDYQQFIQEAGYGPKAHSHGLGNNMYGYRPNPLPEEATTTGWTADRSMRFLRRRDPQRPFFLYTSFDRPHPPLIPPAEFYDIYRDKVFPEPVYGDWCKTKWRERQEAALRNQNFPSWSGREDVIQESLRAYAACITQIDARIGQLIGTLRETGVLHNTWIFFIADHGDMTLDHGLTAKGTFLNGSSGIPYIVVPPETANGTLPDSASGLIDQTHPVGLQDILPTLAEITGAQIPEGITGQSLFPILREETVEKRILCGVIGCNFCAFDGQYRYIWEGDTGEELLFDHTNDFKDMHDLSESHDHTAIKSTLRQGLIDWLGQNDDIHVANGDLVTVPIKTIGGKGALGFDNSPWNNRGWRG